MATVAVFETITRNKMRFQTPKGQLSIEDIWDLPLTGGTLSLDDVAKSLDKELRENGKSFVTKKKTDEKTQIKFDAVMYIIETKLREKEEAQEAAKRRERKQKILEIMENKELEKLSEKSLKELKRELKALEEEGA